MGVLLGAGNHLGSSGVLNNGNNRTEHHMTDRYGRMAMGMAFGCGIGTAFGAAIHNIPAGVALGIAIGALFGALWR
jgi:zinc transporter ZupT